MELIGFRHTEEDIECIKTSCEEQMRATIKEKKNARKKEALAQITSIVFFFLSLYIVTILFSDTVFSWVVKRVIETHKEYGLPFKADVFSLLILFGAGGGFIVTVIVLNQAFNKVLGLRKYFHIHTKYDDWHEAALECREILDYYNNEYQMLMECKDYGARLSEHNNIVFDSVDKDSGLPCVKQICLSQELRDHIFANGTITFEYYDGRLDEIEGKIKDKKLQNIEGYKES